MQSQCRECHKETDAAWREKNHDKLVAYREKNRERARAQDKLRARSKRLAQYGLTEDQFEEMSTAQDGACQICGTVPEQLVVDHDHVTGVVRGLLCRPCNAALGIFKDDPDLLRKAIEYLRVD